MFADGVSPACLCDLDRPLCNRTSWSFVVPLHDGLLIESLLTLLTGVLKTTHESAQPAVAAYYESSLLFSLTWALGSLLGTSHRAAFDECMRELSQCCPPKVGSSRTIIRGRSHRARAKKLFSVNCRRVRSPSSTMHWTQQPVDGCRGLVLLQSGCTPLPASGHL